MKKKIIFLTIVFALFTASSCSKDDDEPIRGCTDPKSLNYNPDANQDNASCSYSNTTFYASAGYYSGVPIMQIDVYVEGQLQGAIQSVYPTGPGNCSAIGTVDYQFMDGNSVDWNTVVYLANGATIFNSGSVMPNRMVSCVKVNVTQ